MSELNGFMHTVMWKQMNIDDCTEIEYPYYDEEMDEAELRYFKQH